MGLTSLGQSLWLVLVSARDDCKTTRGTLNGALYRPQEVSAVIPGVTSERTEDFTMSVRDDIVALANEWVDPGFNYKPTPDELISFFTDAKTEQAPSAGEANKSLATLDVGCYVGGQVKHWCGIFACSVARNAGLDRIRWTLRNGEILGPDDQIKKVWGNSGIQPGDIAVIPHASHHFIVTGTWSADEDPNSSPQFLTVEGNTSGQRIKSSKRNPSEITAYYKIMAN
jgi:hypothetical protein